MNIFKRLFFKKRSNNVVSHTHQNAKLAHNVAKTKVRVKRQYGKKIETVQDAQEYMQHILDNWPAFCTRHRKITDSMKIAIRELRDQETFLLTLSNDSSFNCDDLEDSE